MLIEINVTQDDIDTGEKISCLSCPLSLAISKILDTQFYVKTFGGWMEIHKIYEIGEYIHISLPNECLDFVRLFDKDKPVKPFSFTVDIDKEFLNA